MARLAYIFFATVIWSSSLVADPIRVTSWNVSAGLLESLSSRTNDFGYLNSSLSPDVLVLVEVAGLLEAQQIAKNLGWENYQIAVSDWAKMENNVFFALEAAVISKIPIEQVIEIDASPDGVHSVHDADGILTTVAVTERALDTSALGGIGAVSRFDRGSMRVDLANGLSIFPVHLKSNRNSACIRASDTREGLQRLGIPVPSSLNAMIDDGFRQATDETLNNAVKRERVIAGVKVFADEAVGEGRYVVVAGDFNTAFEPGKVGTSLDDCSLKNFGCSAGPFPAGMCSDDDGFDDTFGILTEPLVGSVSWEIVTKDLERTFDDPRFADKAIDHFAVPSDQAGRFTSVEVAGETFGSDHFPISLMYNPE